MPLKRVPPSRWLGLLVGLYLLALAGPGLGSYFSPDDMMNLHSAWAMEWKALLTANLVCITPEYRPLGGLVYRIIFEIAGFQPLAFRLANFALLFGNLALIHALARVIATPNAAWIAVFAAAFHGSMADLYYSSGTLYDLLCAFFYLLALLLYLHARRAATASKEGVLLAAVLVCFALSLNAKEMAVTLPIAIAWWEIRDSPSRSRRLPVALLAAASAIVLAYIRAKTSPESVLTQTGAYKSAYTLDQFAAAWGGYLGQLSYQADPLPPLAVAAALALAAALCWFIPSRAVRFALPVAIVCTLPVAFVPPRGLFVWYLPILIASIAVGDLADRLPAKRVLLPALAAGLLWIHAGHRNRVDYWITRHEKDIRDLVAFSSAQWPTLPAGSSILFLNDNFLADNYTAYFALRLHYRDPKLTVIRSKMLPPEQPADPAEFQHVVDYRDGRYIEITQDIGYDGRP